MKLEERRTIRKYSDKEVTDELLNSLLERAMRTPTMGNMQLYSVVVTRDADAKRQLAPLHFSQPMVTGAPVVLTFCADFNRFTRWCELRQADPGYDNALSFINAASDTLLFTQTFCNLAEEAGLGTCYLGTTVYQPSAIIQLLQLPRLVFPLATITLGWPAEQPPQPERLPLEAVIHTEHYRDYTPQLIDRLYEEKEQMPENRHFVEVNHKQTLAQVFTDCRYTRSDNESLSVTLLEALRQQGFL